MTRPDGQGEAPERAGRTFAVGSCVGRTFGAWARNVVPFTILTAIVDLPILVWTLSTPPPEPDADMFDLGEHVRSAVTLAWGSMAAGPITYGVVEHLRGAPARFSTCLRVGLSRLLPVLGVGVVVAVLVTIGLLALAVPGLILLCVYWVAVPAAVIERPGIGGALARSAALTRGRRWSVFGVHLVFMVLSVAVVLALWFTILPRDLALPPTRTQQGVEFVLGNVVGSLFAVASAVGYHDLRLEKEGTSADDLARVFE